MDSKRLKGVNSHRDRGVVGETKFQQMPQCQQMTVKAARVQRRRGRGVIAVTNNLYLSSVEEPEAELTLSIHNVALLPLELRTESERGPRTHGENEAQVLVST